MFKGVMRNGVVESGERVSQKEVVCEVYVTKDYSIFKTMEGNRKTNSANKKALMKSMSERYYMNPILVNEDMYIIDGQHRKEVCEELKLPVYYIIQKDLGLEDVKRINSASKVWKTADYLTSNTRDDNPNKDSYEFINKLKTEYKFTVENILVILNKFIRVGSNITDIRTEFKVGSLHLTQKEQDDMMDFINHLEIFKGFKNYHNNFFVQAYYKLYSTEGYDHKIMVNQFNKYALDDEETNREGILKSRYGVADYCESLRDLYNYNRKSGKKADYVSSKRANFFEFY